MRSFPFPTGVQQSGADAFITTPFDSRMLVEKVDTLLNERLVLDPTQAPQTAQVFQSRQEFTVGTSTPEERTEEEDVREEAESASQAFEDAAEKSGLSGEAPYQSSTRTFEGEPVRDEAEPESSEPENRETSFADITPEEGVEPAIQAGPAGGVGETPAFDETEQSEIIDESLLQVDEGVPEGSFEGVLEPEDAARVSEESDAPEVSEATAGEGLVESDTDTGSSYAMSWSEPGREPEREPQPVEEPEPEQKPQMDWAQEAEREEPQAPRSGEEYALEPASFDEPEKEPPRQETEAAFASQDEGGVPAESLGYPEESESSASVSGMEDWGRAQSFEEPQGEAPQVEHGLPNETEGPDEAVEAVEGLVHGMTDQQQMISEAQASEASVEEAQTLADEEAFEQRPGEEALPEFTPEAAHEDEDKLETEADAAFGGRESEVVSPDTGEEREIQADVSSEADAEAPAPQEEAALTEESSGEAPSMSPAPAITLDQLQDAVRKALGEKAEEILRQVAWEVIPELAESIIRRRIQELESETE
ncbi:MAG: hypothetical protein P8018_07160 [Acidobacteriota bacterium]